MTRRLPAGLRRGFTMIEMLIVVVVIGLMLRVALPYLRTGIAKANVTGALSAIASLHSVARTSAIQKGRTAVLVVDHANAKALVLLKKTGSTAFDTVGSVVDLASRWGVTVTTTTDSTVFTPLGIGQGSANNTIITLRSGFADTLVISTAGRLIR